MTENDRQAINIKNKVQEYDDGVISSEELVGYMLDREFLHDTFANDEDDGEATTRARDEAEEREYRNVQKSPRWRGEMYGEGAEDVVFTFDKFMNLNENKQSRVGVLNDSPQRARASRHQDRPANKTRWG